jgi:hypothetical protein
MSPCIVTKEILLKKLFPKWLKEELTTQRRTEISALLKKQGTLGFS